MASFGKAHSGLECSLSCTPPGSLTDEWKPSHKTLEHQLTALQKATAQDRQKNALRQFCDMNDQPLQDHLTLSNHSLNFKLELDIPFRAARFGSHSCYFDPVLSGPSLRFFSSDFEGRHYALELTCMTSQGTTIWSMCMYSLNDEIWEPGFCCKFDSVAPSQPTLAASTTKPTSHSAQHLHWLTETPNTATSASSTTTSESSLTPLCPDEHFA